MEELKNVVVSISIRYCFEGLTGFAVEAYNMIFCLLMIAKLSGYTGLISSSKMKTSFVIVLLFSHDSSTTLSTSIVTVILFSPISVVGLIGNQTVRESA